MAWIFVLVLNGSAPMNVEFDTEWACKDAGRHLVEAYGEEKAKYWCFPKSQ